MSNAVILPTLFLVFVFTPMVAIAQLGPAAAAERLRRSTIERGLEELLESISTRDQGNYSIASLRGLLPSGAEPHSILLQATRDERVRKVFEILASMPRGEAASLVSKSFDKNLARLKSLSAEGKGDEALAYGLHVDLWLSFEFASRESFNRRFNDWNHWFIEGFIDRKHRDLEGPVPDEIQRFAYAKSASPELLMYLNLVLMDQVRSGQADDDSKFAQMLKDAGMYRSLSKSYSMVPVAAFDPESGKVGLEDAEPLLEIPMFRSWGGLDFLKMEQRLELMTKAQNLIDPEGPVEETLEFLTESLLSLGGTVDLSELEVAKAYTGTRVELLGADNDERLAQGWYAERPPTKKQLMAAVDRLRKKISISERADWEEPINELTTWLSEIPESGIDVKKMKSWEWPKSQATPENLVDGENLESKCLIRLVVSETTAFAGKLPVGDDEQKREDSDARTNRSESEDDR